MDILKIGMKKSFGKKCATLMILLMACNQIGCEGTPHQHNSYKDEHINQHSLNGKLNDEKSYDPNLPIVFTTENNTEHITQVGSTVVLHCAAENVGKHTVSWIRRRDYHLLTIGNKAHSVDQRLQVRHIEEENDWQLHIRYVQVHDAGNYECQISSHPPLSLLTSLIVMEATSEILGGPEKYLRIGSSLRLVCVLRKNIQPPNYVFWHLNGRMINYDEQVKVESSGEVSVLFLSNLSSKSSGNYTCEPSNAKASSIHILVLNGDEMPAAIHSSSSALSFSCFWILAQVYVATFMITIE